MFLGTDTNDVNNGHVFLNSTAHSMKSFCEDKNKLSIDNSNK